MEVWVSLDNESCVTKPCGWEIPKIKGRAAGRWQEIGLEKLADLNGNKGHAMIPAHLNGGIKSADCVAMQLLVLDFDHGCTFAQIKKRCDCMGLKMTYAYHTLSSTADEEKFRVVFVCEEVIEDLFIITAVLKILHRIFPECDHSCKNPDRMFFGGKELIYIDPSARIALVQLFFRSWKRLTLGSIFRRTCGDSRQRQRSFWPEGIWPWEM